MSGLERNLDYVYIVLGTALAVLVTAIGLALAGRGERADRRASCLGAFCAMQMGWVWVNAFAGVLPSGAAAPAYTLCALSYVCLCAGGGISRIVLMVMAGVAVAAPFWTVGGSLLGAHVGVVAIAMVSTIWGNKSEGQEDIGSATVCVLCLTAGVMAVGMPLWPGRGAGVPLMPIWSAGLGLGTAAMCVVVACAMTRRQHRRMPGSTRCTWYAAAGGALLLSLAGTWGVTEYRWHSSTEAIRHEHLEYATRLASSMPAEAFADLKYTADDRQNVHYQRIRKHMQAFGAYTGSRCIYSIRQQGGKLLFGPEDLAENDPWASVPGTVYREPPAALLEVFRTGKPAVVGPYQDEFGTAISAYGVVRGRDSIEVVIGIDTVPAACLREAAASRTSSKGTAIGMSVLILLVLVTSDLQARPLGKGNLFLMRYAHTVMLFGTGALAILCAAGVLHQVELEEQDRAFERLGMAYEHSVVEEVARLYENLGHVARYFTFSDTVTANEFSGFTGRMLRTPSIHAYMWTPRVAPEYARPFEAMGRKDGPANYNIHSRPGVPSQRPDDGEHALFPIYYVEPINEVPALGMDLGSEPARRQAILESGRTGLPTATSPTRLMTGELGMLLFWPVAARLPQADGQMPHPSQMGGYATCVLNAQAMLGWVLGKASDHLVANLSVLDISAPQTPVMLCAHPADQVPLQEQIPERYTPRPMMQISPINVGGRTLAVITTPTAEFHADRPLRLRLVTLLVGLPMCLMVSAYIHRSRNRRMRLESLVRQRTRELQESAEHLERILHHLPAGVVIVDCQTQKIVEANPLASAMTGWRRDELIGREHQSAADEIEICPPVGHGKETRHRESVLLDRHGNAIPVAKSVVPITLDGRPCNLEAFLDISELRQLLDEQEVSIGLASQVLQLVNRRPARHIELDSERELFVELLSVACRAAGGDHCLVQTLRTPEGVGERTVISVKDQSGHEVNCVLRSIITDLMHHSILLTSQEKTLEEQLAVLNEQLCSPGLFAEDDFLTTATVEIHHATRTMRYACCGHPPLLVIRRGEVFALPGPSGPGRNVPLGTLADAQFTAGEWMLEDGDQVIVYTDGLTEMPLAAGGAMISCRDLCAIVRDIVRATPGIAVSRIVKQLIERVTTLSGTQVVAGQESTAADDVTIVGIEVEAVRYDRELILAPKSAEDVAHAIVEVHQEITGSPVHNGFAPADPRLRIVLEEAMLNAWRHGNREEPGKPITVRWRWRNDLSLEIVDVGGGFDPDEVHDPRTSQYRREIGGRGVYLIKAMSDSARWRDGGRHVTVDFAAPLHVHERRRNSPGSLPMQWW